jgi:Tol biopolymer transport system component
MSKFRRLVTILLEICALVALVVGLTLILQQRPIAGNGISQSYPAPGTQENSKLRTSKQPELTVQPYPEPTQSSTPEVVEAIAKPPICEFSFSGIAPEPATLSIDTFYFSEPKIVLTSPSALGISSWLTDGERLLFTRQTLDGHQTIETFDYQTGETITYAERDGEASKPVWLDELSAVVYSTLVKDHEELWISYGSPQKVEQIDDNVFGVSLTSDGRKMAFFSPNTGDQPQTWDSSNKVLQSINIPLGNQIYSKFGNDKTIFHPLPGKTFQIAIQPGGKKAAFYGYALLYLADLETGKICEIDLGISDSGPRWASMVKWSSDDGRYLAMTSGYGYPGAMEPNNEMIVLDTFTGEKYQPELKVPFVYDFVWSPDVPVLVALGNVGIVDGRAKMGLFLVGVGKKEAKQMLTEQSFGGGGMGMLAWGKDKLAIDCTSWPQKQDEVAEGRICIIDISQIP